MPSPYPGLPGLPGSHYPPTLLLSSCSFSSSSSTQPGWLLHEAAPRMPGKPQQRPTSDHFCTVLAALDCLVSVAQRMQQGCARAGKAIIHQIGCTLRQNPRRCCRWSIGWHRPETCGMNRRRFPSESASKHQSQSQSQNQNQNQNQKVEAKPQTVGLRYRNATALVGCGSGSPGWPDLDLVILMFGTGSRPTSQHDHSTPRHTSNGRITLVADASRLPKFISRKRSFTQAFHRPPSPRTGTVLGRASFPIPWSRQTGVPQGGSDLVAPLPRARLIVAQIWNGTLTMAFVLHSLVYQSRQSTQNSVHISKGVVDCGKGSGHGLVLFECRVAWPTHAVSQDECV